MASTGGCGGNFSPEDYATEFRKFIAWVPRYGLRLNFIAAGPDAGDWNWTRGFFTKMAEKGDRAFSSLYAWALHYYAGIDAPRKASTDYDEAGWYELLAKADRMESLITEHWAIMGGVDTRHRVKLIVDEWGAWHGRAKEMPGTYLWAYPGTLRDALISGLTLDTFNRHADKVVMANVAQTVNTIHSLFLAHEDKFVATPNFHVFEMYSAHGGGKSVRTVFNAPEIETAVNARPAKLWGLQGSASLHDRQLVLTVVNPHHNQPRDAEVTVRGASVGSCQSRVLASPDIRAHNTFANPRALEPIDGEVKTGGPTFRYRFAPASVTRLRISLV